MDLKNQIFWLIIRLNKLIISNNNIIRKNPIKIYLEKFENLQILRLDFVKCFRLYSKINGIKLSD